MEAMRQEWTDERLDDLTGHMNQGFERLDRDLREVRAEIKALRSELRAEIAATGRDSRVETATLGAELRAEMATLGSELRAEMDVRFARVDARFDSLQRMLLGGYLTAVLAFVATQL